MQEVPIGDKTPDIINIVIEIPAGSQNKYEYDEELGQMVLDRVLPTAFAYPVNYAYIPETRSEDGDHLDALMVLGEAPFPGCVVAARPIGLMKMVDSGENDEKIVCVADRDMNSAHIRELADLGEHWQRRIQHFFEHYKDLENKRVEVTGWGDAAAARAEIVKAMQAERVRQ